MRKGRCETAPRKIPAIERRIRAMELRREGKGYREIGEALGCSTQRAHRIVQEEFGRLRGIENELAVDLLKLHSDRLERLMQTHYGKALTGDKDATELVLKLLDRQARLFGLEAPKKTENKMELSTADPEQLKARARMMGVDTSDLEETRDRSHEQAASSRDDARLQAGPPAGGADVQAPGDQRPE